MVEIKQRKIFKDCKWEVFLQLLFRYIRRELKQFIRKPDSIFRTIWLKNMLTIPVTIPFVELKPFVHILDAGCCEKHSTYLSPTASIEIIQSIARHGWFTRRTVNKVFGNVFSNREPFNFECGSLRTWPFYTNLWLTQSNFLSPKLKLI